MILGIDALLAVAITVIALLGLLVTYGLLGVVNLAHGEMIAIGAYGAWIASLYHGGLLFACLVGIALSGGIGALLEWSVVRRFYGRNIALSLLGTWGISLALVQILRLVFGPAGRFVPQPLPGELAIAGTGYPLYRIVVLLIGVAVLIAVALAVRSRMGLKIRAAMEDAERAESFGIDTRQSFRWTFVVGSALAGLAGALIAPITAVQPNMGSDYTTLGFLALLVVRSRRLAPPILACALLAVCRSLFATTSDANTATLLMYATALGALLAAAWLSGRTSSNAGLLQTWKE